LRHEGIGERELYKWKNKVETTLLLGELGIHSKAGNMAYFDHLGRIDRINEELENYLEVSTGDIKDWAGKILDPTNGNVLVYTT
jgi:hypothetical protein